MKFSVIISAWILLLMSSLIAEIQSELACYSCRHDGKYLCLNDTYYLHMETCPGIPPEFHNISGIKEVCFKTFIKQRRKPRNLITKGCAIQADNFDPCVDLRKVSVVGPKAQCFLCNTSMCNGSDQMSHWNLILLFGTFVITVMNNL